MKAWQRPYNKYFLLPFLLWVVAGGLLLAFYDKQFLFQTINGRHSALSDTFMYAATWMGEATVIIPVLILVLTLPGHRSLWQTILAIACNAIPMVVSQILKSYYDQPRPLAFFHNAAWIHKLPNWPALYYRSFPSGHSEGAFAFFCFMSLLLSDKHRWLGLVFFAAAITVAYSRVYLSAHFFADVYTGSIVGTTCCMLMYFLLNRFVYPSFDKRFSAAVNEG